MDTYQILLLALAIVPTIITALIGILLNSGRLGDLSGYIRSIDARLLGAQIRHAF